MKWYNNDTPIRMSKFERDFLCDELLQNRDDAERRAPHVRLE